MNNPQVSVLMSVYNSEKFLCEAIGSILKQSFADFEFIIINDGSTDSTQQIIESYPDERIVILNNAQNLGLAESLNRGIREAQGEYIARMDADDISLPERLEKQVAFMKMHSEVGLCGTWIKYFGEENLVLEFPPDDATIRCKLLFENNIAHPSVIMRKDLLLKHELLYNPAYTNAQDYELWRRCSQYLSFANLSEVLLLYRLHPEQAGKSNFAAQQKLTGLVRLEELKSLGINVTPEELALHEAITWYQFQDSEAFLEKVQQWLIKIKMANSKSNYYPEPQFSNIVDNKWLEISNICEG